MLQSFINNLQIYQGKRLPGFVDENMLLQAYQMEPEKLSTLITVIFSTKWENYTSCIEMLTGGIGHKRAITTPYYDWELEVADEKPVAIVSATTNGSAIEEDTEGIGMNYAPIYLTLKEKMFATGAILELDDNNIQLRVQKSPIDVPGGYQYECVATGRTFDKAIPGKYLVQGCYVSRVGSAYEEFSDEGDIISYQTHARFRSYLGIQRLQVGITRSAVQDVLAYAYKDPATGKSSFLWADIQIWKAHRDFMLRRDYMAWNGQGNTRPNGTVTLKGSNGRYIRIPAGLKEQIAPANSTTYTELTYKLIDDFLVTMGYNVKGMKERRYSVFTGEMGMRLINDVLLARFGSIANFAMPAQFVTGEGQNLKLQGQFTGVKFPNGYVCDFFICPYLDDPTHNRLEHPVDKKPLSSYDFYFIDTTMRGGKSNIMKIYKEGAELIEWTTAGSVVPKGYSHNDVRSDSRDGYFIHMLCEEAHIILDPRGCGKMIMDVG